MLDYSQLEALLGIEEEGTIEGAARALRVSSFAISQRISQLENTIGTVLVERGPTRTSKAGKILCDHAREVSRLEDQLLASYRNGTFLDNHNEPPILRIALTEEIINGWFRQVIKDCCDTDSVTSIDVTTCNPDRSIALMQSGDIVAGVSTVKKPVNGFKAFALGHMTYVAVASPRFINAHFSDGITPAALSKAPVLRYCHNDSLAPTWVEQRFAKPPVLPLRKLPDITGALNSVLSGDSWTMVQERVARPLIVAGELTELIPDTPVNQPIFWHVAIAMLDTMDNLTKSIRGHANWVVQNQS